jgi:hypothetical protein
VREEWSYLADSVREEWSYLAGLSFEIRRLSRTRSSSGEEQDDRFLKSSSMT